VTKVPDWRGRCLLLHAAWRAASRRRSQLRLVRIAQRHGCSLCSIGSLGLDEHRVYRVRARPSTGPTCI